MLGGNNMSLKTLQGNQKLANQIKLRRTELNLTIEEAAKKAGVGTKTWYRYETGASIRKDKCKGICKALNWHTLPTDAPDIDNIISYDEYKSHEAWSSYLADNFGEQAATSFAVGSDILIDSLEDDLSELSQMPIGTHIGQINCSLIKDYLPQQFLMKYDYNFIYLLHSTVLNYRSVAHAGQQIIAHSVLEELALYLIVEHSRFYIESIILNDETTDDSEFTEWLFDILGDMDIITCLYSGYYLPEDHLYHFNHWLDNQFYCK